MVADRISTVCRDATKLANEMGYFPTPAQAKQISLVAAALWFSRYPESKGAIPNEIYTTVMHDAIEAFHATGK